MKVYTQCSAEVTGDPLPHHCHCNHDAAREKAVTIIVEQRSWLKVLEQTHQFGGKYLWCHSCKNFCKYNYLNDQVITKLQKFSTMKICNYTV